MSTAEAVLDRVETTPEAVAPEELMQRLLAFDPVGMPVISLYLDARVDQHGKHQFLTFARKQLADRGKSYSPHSAERESFEEDFVRIVRYLENGVPTSAQGLAIFACSAANDYFEVGLFDAPFERNRLFVYNQPHLYPLARLIDHYRRYAVVLANTNRVQIFVFAAARTIDHHGLENLTTKRADVGGWVQSRYHRHDENCYLLHANEIIKMLERTVAEDAVENIILAGDQETVIPILQQRMPKALSDMVIDVLSLGINTAEQEVLEQSLEAFRTHDRLTDMQKVEELLSEYRADNLAVAGVPETLAALSNGQAQEMLIAASPQSLQYDKAEVERVLSMYGGNTETMPVLDRNTIADELVRRAKELSAARITFVEDATRLEQLGGVGALLRYRISAESAAPYEDPRATPRAEALIET